MKSSLLLEHAHSKEAARHIHRAKPMRGGDAAHSRTYLFPNIYPPPLATAFGMDGDLCYRRDDDVYSIFIYV